MNCLTKKIQFFLSRSIHLDNQIIYNSFVEKKTRYFQKKENLLFRSKRNKIDQTETLGSLNAYKSDSSKNNEQNLVQSCKYTYSKKTSAQEIPSNWMSDYQSFPETTDIYGKSKKTLSQIACGGCGSSLQCQNSSLPGFLPEEIFNNSSNLHQEICKRCHFLKHYKTALNVTISSDEYPKILSQIKDKNALVILMVDILDYPCSFWPDIEKIIGNKRPIILVGNKIDLLPRDSPDYLKRISNTLLTSLNNFGLDKLNVKHVSLISAKSGFGIEELINTLHLLWKSKGDVYLIGCTNVGKSTLFNALIQSDYCKVQAIDLVQRATTSLWPGTTLNLLKFPILRPSRIRLHHRGKRLMELREKQGFISDIENEGSSIPNVGRTFASTTNINTHLDPFSHELKYRSPDFGVDPQDKDYVLSKWCYDTPGVIHPEQLNQFLTIEELIKTLPQSKLMPKSFRIFPGWTLFIGGLARLDLITSKDPLIMTVLASEYLPITVCETENANQLYKNLLGSPILGVPLGSKDRLSTWPELASQLYSVTGIGLKKSAADIVFSTAGWISITLKEDEIAQLQAWTPEGKGLYKRNECLLPNCVQLKGPLIRKTPVYSTINK